MLWKGIIIFGSAALVGSLIGWSSGGTVRKEAPAAGISAPIRESARPKWAKDDFVAAARQRSEAIRTPGYNPYAVLLADWTDDEIRAALEASLVHPDCALPFGAGQGMSNSLLGEWMRRDLDAALAWLERIESQSVKGRMIMALSYQWPADRAEEGLAYVRSHRELFPAGSCWSIVTKNVESAAKKGPAAVADLLRVLREEKFDLSFGNPVSFPQGFDFAKLAGSEEFQQLGGEEGMGRSMIRAWHAQDREQVFAWLLEQRGVASLKLIAAGPDGYRTENLKWLGGKVEGLDPEARREYVEAAREGWILMPNVLQGFSEGVRDPVLLEELRGLGVQSIFAGNAHAAVPLLEAIPDPARRVELLATAEPDALFSKQPYRRAFDAADEALLRKKLAEWNTGEDRIESIISRYRR